MPIHCRHRRDDAQPKTDDDTCWPGSPITKSPTSPRCCRGIVAARSLSSAPPDVAAPAHAIIIRRAAEILGEDETLLWEIASDMEPEDGCLWIYDMDNQQTVAFTPAGMEYLREMFSEYKRNQSPPRP
jgi:hypothetical protein